MKHRLRTKQFGLISIIALLFLGSVVLILLSKTLEMSGSKNLEAKLAVDNAAAMALAESGIAAAIGEIRKTSSSGGFAAACAKYSSSTLSPNTPINNVITQSPGNTYQYVGASIASTASRCPIRVLAIADSAKKSLEVWLDNNTSNTTNGNGLNITLPMTNPYNTPAYAFFNLAYKVQAPGGQSLACPADTPCSSIWNYRSQTGNTGVGGLGALSSSAISPGNSIQVGVTLTDARDYSAAGVFIGSSSNSPPTLISYYYDNSKCSTGNTTCSQVANKQTGATSNGLTSPSSKPWCNDADTLIYGISSLIQSTRADYSSVIIGNNNTPLESAITYYDTNANLLLTKILYKYNNRIRNSSGTAITPTITAINGNEITLSPAVNLDKLSLIKVYASTASSALPMTVTGCNDGTLNSNGITCESVTKIIVDTPSRAVKNQPVCGGSCALFDDPTNSSSTTGFSLNFSAPSSFGDFVSGFACFKGVDPAKIKPIINATASITKWHEVTSLD